MTNDPLSELLRADPLMVFAAILVGHAVFAGVLALTQRIVQACRVQSTLRHLVGFAAEMGGLVIAAAGALAFFFVLEERTGWHGFVMVGLAFLWLLLQASAAFALREIAEHSRLSSP